MLVGVTEEVKTLPLEFTARGYDYRQIWREKDVAVYEYSSVPTRFELIIILVEKAGMKFGRYYESHERYPRSSQWGQYGWSFGPGDRDFVLRIAAGIVGLAPKDRIPKIHQFMDHWPKEN